MTSVSAGHIILTSTKPVGNGRPQHESNQGPPHQESGALPTELPRPPTGMMRLVDLAVFVVMAIRTDGRGLGILLGPRQ